jgi:hypothetical protein
MSHCILATSLTQLTWTCASIPTSSVKVSGTHEPEFLQAFTQAIYCDIYHI